MGSPVAFLVAKLSGRAVARRSAQFSGKSHEHWRFESCFRTPMNRDAVRTFLPSGVMQSTDNIIFIGRVVVSEVCIKPSAACASRSTERTLVASGDPTNLLETPVMSGMSNKCLQTSLMGDGHKGKTNTNLLLQMKRRNRAKKKEHR